MQFPHMWIAAAVFFLLTAVFGVGRILELRKNQNLVSWLSSFFGLLALGCLAFGARILIFIFWMK